MSFFFNDTATTEIYTLSLHDALPISDELHRLLLHVAVERVALEPRLAEAVHVHHDLHARVELDVPVVGHAADRKSTRLNSSHANISYAVFCLKKKKLLTLTMIQTSPY